MARKKRNKDKDCRKPDACEKSEGSKLCRSCQGTKHMRALWKNPLFRATQLAKSVKRAEAPEFREALLERNRMMWANEDYVKARIADLEKINASLESNPKYEYLAAMTKAERRDYDFLRKKHRFRKKEALEMIGRKDLL